MAVFLHILGNDSSLSDLFVAGKRFLLGQVHHRNVDFAQGDILVQLVGNGNCSAAADFVVLGLVGVVLLDLALHSPVEVVVDLYLLVTVVVNCLLGPHPY